MKTVGEKILAFTTLCLISTSAVATDTASKLSGSASITRRDSMIDYQDGTKESYMEYVASLGYAITETQKIGVVLVGTQDLIAKEADLDRVQFSFRPTSIAIEKSKVITSIGLGLPVSKVHKTDSFQGLLTGLIKLEADAKKLNWSHFGMSMTVNLVKNFHQYDTKVNGNINTEYSSMQAPELSWAFNDVFSASLTLIHYNTWNYNGTLGEYFGHSQNLSYQYSSNLTFSLGHAYGNPVASAKGASGQDYKLPLTDESQSYIYGGAAVTF